MKNDKEHNEYYLSKWIDGRLSDEEFKTLVSSTDFLVYKKMAEGISVLERLDAPMDKTFSNINARIEPSNNRFRFKTWSIGIAASIVLCLGLYSILNTSKVNYETGFGEQKTFALLDGSQVILNSKSEISFDEVDWKTNRTLYLDGEAYFKVTKGNTFTVKTKNGSVEVLGTQFNVNSSDDFFKVVCYEGKVSVSQGGKSVVLLPTDHIRKINGHAAETWESSTNAPSWINGESTFRSAPLKYVIKALEAQYNVSFDATDIDTSVVFTGSFTHNNLEVALKSVFNAIEVTYNEKEKNIIKLSFD